VDQVPDFFVDLARAVKALANLLTRQFPVPLPEAMNLDNCVGSAIALLVVGARVTNYYLDFGPRPVQTAC
jgi:hypothetical protein